MKLYRVEKPNSHLGLWYNNNTQGHTGIVHSLNLSGKTLPMDFNPNLAKEQWRSAADSIDQLKFWFTHDDLRKLQPLGYKLYEIETDHFILHTTEWYAHPLFQDVRVSSKLELDIDLLLPNHVNVG